MYSQSSRSFGGAFGGMSGGGPPPRDILILLGVILFTFSLRFFDGLAVIPQLLELNRGVYRLGLLWQLVTYPFVGIGVPGLWFLVELFFLFLFSRDVYSGLGRKRFWRLILTVAFGAAAAAVVTQLLADLVAGPGGGHPAPFALMQGQHMLFVIVISAFAVLYRHATIMLFFIIPVPARWFLWLTILMGFMGFLGSRDLAGFLGICAGVGLTYGSLMPGGLGQLLHRWKLRIRHFLYQAELTRMRKKRKLRIVKDDDGPTRGPWVN